MVKNPPANMGDARKAGSVLGLGRSLGGGSGNPLQCSYLDNPWAEVPGGLHYMEPQRVGHYRARTHMQQCICGKIWTRSHPTGWGCNPPARSPELTIPSRILLRRGRALRFPFISSLSLEVGSG